MKGGAHHTESVNPILTPFLLLNPSGLVINFVACAINYYLLSVATTLPVLFLSKVPGVAMAGFLCAQVPLPVGTLDAVEGLRGAEVYVAWSQAHNVKTATNALLVA